MILTSPLVSVYYVEENPNKTIDDLSTTTDLIYKFLDLSWTEPSQPGTYHIYWLVQDNWIDSGLSTSGSSLQIEPPRNATRVQLRTDDLYPSNTINISFHELPEQREINLLERYNGILVSWDPNTKSDERVEVEVDNTTEFYDSAQSYFHEFGGVFRVRFSKGSGSDVVFGPWSSSKFGSLLPQPPNRVEPEEPCDFYLGINRAGDQIMHICNPSVVPETPPIVESGKTAVDWFQDWVGINLDYGPGLTYFHSMFDYIYCTQAVRLRDYTDSTYYGSNDVRRFDFTGAEDIPTGNTVTFTLNEGRMLMVIEVDDFGNRTLANPALVREIDVTDNNFAVDVLYFGNGTGFGLNGAYYTSNNTYIRTNRSVRYLEVYEFNIQANGLDLEYIDLTGSNNGIILNENEFEVAGNDFSGMFLAYTGICSDGDYVDSMNLSDSIIATVGSVDPLGIYHGTTDSDTVQVLGSSGGSGWDVTMETGIIKRAGNTWFNAGRGRTRMRYRGISDSDSTNSFEINIPEHPVFNEGLNLSLYEETGNLSNESVIINSEISELSEVLGFCIVPTSYGGVGDDWLDLETTQKPVLGFSSFSERVLIHSFRKTARFNETVLSNGDPWWGTNYNIKVDLYLKKLSQSQFVIEYDLVYRASYGSGGLANSVWLPGFSISFIGLS